MSEYQGKTFYFRVVDVILIFFQIQVGLENMLFHVLNQIANRIFTLFVLKNQSF